VGALKKRTYSEILRPSVAQTKLRAAYSLPSQVASGGLLAGAAAFLSPLIVYIVGSAIAQALPIKGPDFSGRMQWLIEYFGIRLVAKSGPEQTLINYIVLTVFFAVIGLISGFVYKMSTISEDSATFFMRRLRFPFEIMPFFLILLFSAFTTASHVLLGIVTSILMGCIWRFYYGKALGFISTVDVSKVIPDTKIN